MTVDKKRIALVTHCEHMTSCSQCPINDCSIMHCDFTVLNDKAINLAYERVFPGADNGTDNGIDATPHIKDSGERRQFDTGAVRDIQEGKGRCDLMPLDVVGAFLNNPTLCYISKFQETGEVSYLRDALSSSGVFHDPYTMFLEVAKHFEEGAKKYSEDNWRKGINAKNYVDSGTRHYLKYLRGDKDEPHDRAFVWNMMACWWTCEHKPELNDYLVQNDNIQKE